MKELVAEYGFYVALYAALLSSYIFVDQKLSARAKITFIHRILDGKILRTTVTNLSSKPITILEVRYFYGKYSSQRNIPLKTSMLIDSGVAIDIDIELEKEANYLDGVSEFEFISSINQKHIYKLPRLIIDELRIEFLKVAAESFAKTDMAYNTAMKKLKNNLESTEGYVIKKNE